MIESLSAYSSSSGSPSSDAGAKCRGTSERRAVRRRPNSSSYSIIGSSYTQVSTGREMIVNRKIPVHPLELEGPSTTRPRPRYLTHNSPRLAFDQTAWSVSVRSTLTRTLLTSTKSASYCLSFRPPVFPFRNLSYIFALRSRAARADSNVGLLMASRSISRLARSPTPLFFRDHIVAFYSEG